MIRYFPLLFALFSLQCNIGVLRRSASLSYEIYVLPDQHRIDIRGTMTGLRDGDYYFILPQTQGQPARHFIKDLTFRDAGGPVAVQPTLTNEWRVDVESDSISFTYGINVLNAAVYQDEAWGGAISQLDERMAFLSGGMSFIIPLVDNIEQPIRLNWKVPENWHVVTPWSVDELSIPVPSQYGLVRNYYIAFTGGSILQRRIRNMDVSMVWVGKDDINRFRDMELATQRVIDAAITLFDGPTTRDHLTLILRDTNPGNRFRASTESNSIEFNFKQGITFERLWQDHRDGFLRLLAHEIMHTWDRREVRRASEFLSVREWGGNTCWLREGFTEYFANLNLYHAGLYDRDEFVNTIQALSTAAHQVNELGKISLIEACMPFWNDVSAMQYVYTEGASLAFMLDMELRRATNGEKSLPLFMREFLENYRYQEKTVEAFVEAWQVYAPASLSDLNGMLEMRSATDLSAPLRMMDVELITGQGEYPERWSVPETASFGRYFSD